MTLAFSYSLIIALGLSLAILVIVHVVSAVRHTKAEAIIGSLETEKAINARIESKKEYEEELREKIIKLDEAFVEKAEKQAEVDGLLRRRDELLAEWNSLNEKREEVREVRAESEKAMLEKNDLDNQLREKKSELEQVSNKLQIAEDLVKQIDALKSEQSQLIQEVEELKNITSNLKEDEKSIKGLLEIEEGLNESIRSIENQIGTKEDELKELTKQMEFKEIELVNINAKLIETKVQLEDTDKKLNETSSNLDKLKKEAQEKNDEKSHLDALIATYKVKLEDLKKETTKQDGKESDSSSVRKDVLNSLERFPDALNFLKESPELNNISEEEALEKASNHFKDQGLDFSDRTLNAFHTALKVNESTQMAVLAGISGTGKSQLPRQYAKSMGIGFLQVPVQPRWDSPQDLMGFYNYIENKYFPTELARALWKLDEFNKDTEPVKDRMLLILLDELNLSRVEYYFSDFLSRLESRPLVSSIGVDSARKDAEFELEIPKLPKPPRIFPNYNLLFTGSMNEDETTQSLSEKVIDRANILRFAAPKELKTEIKDVVDKNETVALSYNCWRSWIDKRIVDESEKSEINNLIVEVKQIMEDFERPFGHRLGYAMTSFAIQYPKYLGSSSIRNALADQVEMRLLPKLRGVEVDEPKISDAFNKLEEFVENKLDDHKLAEALLEYKKRARNSGQFVWGGVIR